MCVRAMDFDDDFEPGPEDSDDQFEPEPDADDEDAQWRQTFQLHCVVGSRRDKSTCCLCVMRLHNARFKLFRDMLQTI